jgi:hypothetical protein
MNHEDHDHSFQTPAYLLAINPTTSNHNTSLIIIFLHDAQQLYIKCSSQWLRHRV